MISGDALCDFDLTAIVAAHKAGGAVATLGLKSVENPLEFGVVIIDEDGRIERFLEKPSWGQVFSDTINTGVYVLEPEVLKNVPADEPYDFSKQLFPALLSRGKHLYGHVLEGYWQDVGNLEQYRQANFDALDGRIELELPGIRLRDNVYLGDGVQLPELGQIQGPAFVGNYSKIESGARIGAYSVLGQNAVVKDGAQIERSVIDSGSYIGMSARIEGAILGKGVDVRAHAVVNEGVAIGDECSIGSQSVLAPNVKVYPFKTIEAGAAIHSNLIWESRGITTLFGRDEVSGLVNVDITPDVASRIGMAYGTTLARDARIVVSRDANPAARMIKRSLISGFAATGVNVSDLRVAMPAVARHQLKIDERAGGVHVQISPDDPEVVEIRFFEAPGILVSDATIKSIERTYSRQEFRRVSATEIGRLTLPLAGDRDLRAGPARDPGRGRDPRTRVPDGAELRALAGLAGGAEHDRRPRGRVDLDERAGRRRRPADQDARAVAGRDGADGARGRRRGWCAAGHRGRANLAGGRDRAADRGRDDAAPAAARAVGADRERDAAGAGDGDVRGGARGERLLQPGRAHPGLAARAAVCGHRGGRAVRGRIRRRLRVSRLPARLRRAGVDRQGARDPGPLAGHPVGAGPRACPRSRACTPRHRARGRSRAPPCGC